MGLTSGPLHALVSLKKSLPLLLELHGKKLKVEMDKNQLQLSLKILFCSSGKFFGRFIVNFAKPYLMYAQVKEKFLLLWSELDLCKAIMRLFH